MNCTIAHSCHLRGLPESLHEYEAEFPRGPCHLKMMQMPVMDVTSREAMETSESHCNMEQVRRPELPLEMAPVKTFECLTVRSK